MTTSLSSEAKSNLPWPYLITQLTWYEQLKEVFASEEAQKLAKFLETEKRAGKKIFPDPMQYFRAINTLPLWSVKTVIIGQDPYPTEGYANGLAFSVPGDLPRKSWPGSLQNIAKTLKIDLGKDLFSGDLSGWGYGGVLLLNRILSVQEGMPLSHAGKGWEFITDGIIKAIIRSGRPVIWVLWGKVAQDAVLPLLEQAKVFDQGHELITAVHPSPLSAYRGFFWHRPFSKINQFCENMGYRPVMWGI